MHDENLKPELEPRVRSCSIFLAHMKDIDSGHLGAWSWQREDGKPSNLLELGSLQSTPTDYVVELFQSRHTTWT